MSYENVSCSLCGKKNNYRLFIANDWRFNPQKKFQVVKCRNCGLIYINPRPKQEEIGNFYPEESYWGCLGQNERSKKEILENYGEIYQLVKDCKPRPGRVLDVGCGSGELLSLLKKDGWQCFGVEINPKAASYVKKLWQIDVKNKELKKNDFPAKNFDVIVLSHVLEHLPDPIQTLKIVRTALKDDGTLVIAVPNIRSINAKIFRSYWYALDVPRHLLHFNSETLQKMLRRAGFKIISQDFFSVGHSKAGFKGSLKNLYVSKNSHYEKEDRQSRIKDQSNKNQSVPSKIMGFFGLGFSFLWSFLGMGEVIMVKAKKV
jgi:2-polyprenyl-3-methyl-5-hydroxy-6-metoxy-1,4-benzoquinol methylase